MAAGMFIFAKDFTIIFYGKEMVLSYKVLRIFCITLLFSFTHGLMGYPVLAALGHSKEANYSIVVASICHISLLFVLLYLKVANIYTVAMLTAVAEGLVFLYRVLVINKYKLWRL